MTHSSLPYSSSGKALRNDFPARITKAGSKQTYYTFKLLADRDREEDALRAYAYYRWLDDQLDCSTGTIQDKTALLLRQQNLMETCYQKHQPGEVSPEEQMLVELVHNDKEENSGLQVYLRNMMAVMNFDVGRCGRVISQEELAEYTRMLSTAVTELLFYLIGHESNPTSEDGRYHAVSGAHVVHMLRDLVEDVSAGYFNIPDEYLKEKQLSFEQLNSLEFRRWVFGRVGLARQYFSRGRTYIARVKSLRCRLAGFAYLARFEWMLKLIERDGYHLRADYPERKRLPAGLWIAWRTFISVLNIPWVKLDPGPQVALIDQGEGR